MTSEELQTLGAELMSTDDFTSLGAELMAADEAGDVSRLADLAWQLYSEAGVARSETLRLHGLLRCAYSRPGHRSAAGTHPDPPGCQHA